VQVSSRRSHAQCYHRVCAQHLVGLVTVFSAFTATLAIRKAAFGQYAPVTKKWVDLLPLRVGGRAAALYAGSMQCDRR
jgi:hypothetical protein